MNELMEIAAEFAALGYTLYDERVAVIRDEAEDKIGNIIIPETAKMKPIRGTVVMVGEAVTTGILVGDRVVFTKYNPLQLELETMSKGKVMVEVMHALDIYVGWRDA